MIKRERGGKGGYYVAVIDRAGNYYIMCNNTYAREKCSKVFVDGTWWDANINNIRSLPFSRSAGMIRYDT